MTVRTFQDRTLDVAVVSRRPQKSPDIRRDGEGWDVRLEFSIRSDARRLYQALTLPEYLETWLSFPGHPSGCAMLATKNNDEYLIDHLCNGRRTAHVSGSFIRSRRHNLVFSWRIEGHPYVPESCVSIQLRGDFENTRVQLCHSGLASHAQSTWHKELWTQSITRLIGLY